MLGAPSAIVNSDSRPGERRAPLRRSGAEVVRSCRFRRSIGVV